MVIALRILITFLLEGLILNIHGTQDVIIFGFITENQGEELIYGIIIL